LLGALKWSNLSKVTVRVIEQRRGLLTGHLRAGRYFFSSQRILRHPIEDTARLPHRNVGCAQPVANGTLVKLEMDLFRYKRKGSSASAGVVLCGVLFAAGAAEGSRGASVRWRDRSFRANLA